MNFNKNPMENNLLRIMGYILMYFIFTTILYFALGFLNKFPENWNYFYVTIITLGIVLIGKLLHLFLR